MSANLKRFLHFDKETKEKMILAPSPQTLLHKKDPNYVMPLMCGCPIPDGLRNAESDPTSNQGATQSFIDLYFLTSSGENPKVMHSSYYSAFILQHALKNNNPLFNLSFAFLALQIDDILGALHFLKEAAKNGNVDAVNLIGWIYWNYRSRLSFQSIEQANRESLLWFFRGIKLGSLNSNYFLGDYYANIHQKSSFNQNLISAYFYSRLVNDQDYHTSHLTHQLIKLFSMLYTDPNQPQNSNSLIDKSLKKLIYSISKTGDSMIPLYIKTLFQNDTEMVKIWSKVPSPLDTKLRFIQKKQDLFKIDDHYTFNEKLAAPMKDNTTIHLTRWLNQLLGTIDPFKSFKTSSFILQRYSPDSNGPKVSTVDDYKRKQREKNESEFHKEMNKQEEIESLGNYNGYNEPISAYFPSKNKTAMLLQVFELASPKFIKRNLVLASTILQNIYNENHHGLIDSRLWQNKIQSKKASDQIRCGFICWLMNDRISSFLLFESASIQGSKLASLMCALLLFYSLLDPTKSNDIGYDKLAMAKKHAIPYFLKCIDDPIASLNLYMITKDTTYYERAMALLGLSLANSAEMDKQNASNSKPVTVCVQSDPFELIGDMFLSGVKFVRDVDIARAFYSHAITIDTSNSVMNTQLYSKFETTKIF